MRHRLIGDIAAYALDGPPGAATLVLLHGYSDSGRCWPDAVRRWSPRFGVVALDARGHGRSPRFEPDALAGEPAAAMVEDTIRVLATLSTEGSGPIGLVGHSMGGGVAAAVAAERPDLVAAMVLEDPAMRDDPHETRLPNRVWGAEQRRYLTWFHADPAAGLDQGRADNPLWPQDELAPWAQAKLDTDIGLATTGDIRVHRPWPELVAALTTPTLFVTGTSQVVWGPAGAEALGAHAPAPVEVAVVDGASHCVRRTRTEEFHALVDPWLASRLAT